MTMNEQGPVLPNVKRTKRTAAELSQMATALEDRLRQRKETVDKVMQGLMLIASYFVALLDNGTERLEALAGTGFPKPRFDYFDAPPAFPEFIAEVQWIRPIKELQIKVDYESIYTLVAPIDKAFPSLSKAIMRLKSFPDCSAPPKPFPHSREGDIKHWQALERLIERQWDTTLDILETQLWPCQRILQQHWDFISGELETIDGALLAELLATPVDQRSELLQGFFEEAMEKDAISKDGSAFLLRMRSIRALIWHGTLERLRTNIAGLDQCVEELEGNVSFFICLEEQEEGTTQ